MQIVMICYCYAKVQLLLTKLYFSKHFTLFEMVIEVPYTAKSNKVCDFSHNLIRITSSQNILSMKCSHVVREGALQNMSFFLMDVIFKINCSVCSNRPCLYIGPHVSGTGGKIRQQKVLRKGTFRENKSLACRDLCL